MNDKLRRELRNKYNNMDPKNLFMGYYEIYDKTQRQILYKTGPLIKAEYKKIEPETNREVDVIIDPETNKEVDIYFIKQIKPINECFEDNKYRFVVKGSSLYLDIDEDQIENFKQFQQEASEKIKTPIEVIRKSSK